MDPLSGWPSAKELRAYNDACPGFAEMMIDYVKKAQDHRHNLDKSRLEHTTKVHNDYIDLEKRRYFSVIGIIVFLVVAAGVCGRFVHPYVGTALAASSGLTMVVPFLKRTQNK
nr:DUF2335 domain-containing protein [Lewinella sp. JB7]